MTVEHSLAILLQHVHRSDYDFYEIQSHSEIPLQM